MAHDVEFIFEDGRVITREEGAAWAEEYVEKNGVPTTQFAKSMMQEALRGDIAYDNRWWDKMFYIRKARWDSIHERRETTQRDKALTEAQHLEYARKRENERWGAFETVLTAMAITAVAIIVYFVFGVNSFQDLLIFLEQLAALLFLGFVGWGAVKLFRNIFS